MKRKLKGSLTVFFALIMTSVITLMFAMAECIRIYELNVFAREYLDMAVESAFSEYNPYLWKNYRILAVDLAYGTDVTTPAIMEQKTVDYCNYNSNGQSGNNYGRLIADNCTVDKYSLLTDGSGQGVKILGIKAAKQGMSAQLVEELQRNDNDLKTIPSSSVKDQAANARLALENAKATRLEAMKNNPDGDYPEPQEVEDNPLDAFEIMKEAVAKGVLTMVVPVEKVSEKAVVKENLPSHRTLNQGNINEAMDYNLVDQALFIDYLLTNYAYYGHGKSDGFKYEIEYLINGKDTDSQNLAAVVEELMLVREAANFATITSNGTMRNQASAIAHTIAGFTMNEAIIQAVAYGIMAAWAYIESILDIRTLLAGGRIPLVKTLDDWTSDVYHLSQCMNLSTKAKETPTGITYKEYLMGFLTVKADSTLAIRACDVMEVALNSQEDYKNTKIDNMLFKAEFSMSYVGNELFLPQEGYQLIKTKAICY